MKKFLSIILLFTFIFTMGNIGGLSVFASDSSLSNYTKAKTIDVWLIAGQSNAMGYANWSNYPTDPEYSKYKTMLESGASNVLYMGTTATEFSNVKASATRTGAEVGIATSMMDKDGMNAIIKVAWGNTSLYNNTTSKEATTYGTWTAPSYIEKYNINTLGNKVGDLYLNFIKKVKYGLDELKNQGYTPIIKGVWYMQGEADTFSKTPAEAYQEIFEMLIDDMRKDITEVSGMDCSYLPFVYGRVLRKDGIDPDKNVPYMDATPYVPTVQAAQDAVNAKNIKNVYMINTSTDLIDPVTKEHKAPFQQDGWHYDSLTQQMIGEKFVSIVNEVSGIPTKYGFIPEEKSNLPLAVFKLNNDEKTYTFVDGYDSIKLAMEGARSLTLASAPLTKEAVILVTKDFAHKNYPSNMSDVGGTITIDLNGNTLSPLLTLLRTDVDDCMASGEGSQKKAVFNVKNGGLKVGEYGLIYNTSSGSYTNEKTIELNLDNVELGFYEDYSSKENNFKDLLVSDRNYTHEKAVNIDVNLNNCTLDLVTNARSVASIGVMNTSNPSTDKETSKYNVNFKNCVFKANSESNLSAAMSNSGDSITYKKGDDGTFGKVYLPKGTYTKAYQGLDDGAKISLKLKSDGASNGSYTLYSLVPSADVTTGYGVIPSDYSDANEYPLVVYKKNKNDASYSFVGGYNVWKTALSAATNYIKGANDATKDDEAVVLLRRDFSFSDLYTSSAIGGSLTFDLNGYTLSYEMSLMNTGFSDFGTGKGGTAYINIKNGNMICNTKYGIFYSQVTASGHTIERGYEFNFDNVNISYGPSGSTTSLLMHLSIASDLTSETPDYKYNMIFNNCVIDMTKAPENAYIAKINKNVGADDTYNKVDNAITFKGGKIIGADETDIVFSPVTSGDSINFDKNSDGNYPVIVLDSDTKFPEDLVFNNSSGTLLICGNFKEEKLITTYNLEETTRVLTPYGEIPASYSDEAAYPFAVFYKDSNGAYQFSKGYNTYKDAMNAAVTLTKPTASNNEAVVYLRRDWSGSGYPSYTSSVATKITLDLNNKTFGALESLCNTSTSDVTDSSGNIIATNGVIDVINGTLLLKVHGAVYIAKTGSYTAGYEKTLTFNFKNVNFGFLEGATSISLIGRVASNHTTANAYYNMNFDNCTFDMVTNRSTNDSLGLANWTLSSDYANVNLEFTDCKFIGKTEDDFKHTLGTNDKVVYNKTSGDAYATLTLPKDALAPTGEYALTDSYGVFKPVSETDSMVTYGLYAKKAIIDAVSVTKYDDYKVLNAKPVTTVVDKALFSDGILTDASGVTISYPNYNSEDTYKLNHEENANQHILITLDKIYTLDSIPLVYYNSHRWVEFNVKVSKDNIEWTDLGSRTPKVSEATKGLVIIDNLNRSEAKYIKLSVVKRQATSSDSVWGPGLKTGGCSITICELSVNGEEYAEEKIPEALTVSYGTVTKYKDGYKVSGATTSTMDIDLSLLSDGKATTASSVGIDYASSGNEKTYNLNITENRSQHWLFSLDKVSVLNSIELVYNNTHRWVEFNVKVSEDNNTWNDLGTIKGDPATTNGQPVILPLNDAKGKYIKLTVVRRQATSSDTTIWGPGLGAGCSLNLYEIGFLGYGVENPEEDKALTAFDKVFASKDTITLSDGSTYTGLVGVVFARAKDKIGEYTRTEYGVALSENKLTKDEFATDSSVIFAKGEKINDVYQYGIRFYGEKLKEADTYYTLPYAKYKDASGNEMIVFNDNVIPFTPIDEASNHIVLFDSFEDGLDKWTVATKEGTTVEISENDSSKGNKSIYLLDKNTSGTFSVKSPFVEVTEGTGYDVSFDIKNIVNNTIKVYCKYFNSSKKEIASSSIGLSGSDWHTDHEVSIAPEGAQYLQIWMAGTSSGTATVYIDNIKVRKLSEEETKLYIPKTLDAPEVIEGIPTGSDEEFHIYLCLGQSNMVGYDDIQNEDIVVVNDAYLLNGDGKWEKAQPYPHPKAADKEEYMGFNRYSTTAPGTGEMGPTIGFSRGMVENIPEGVKIGIISNAIGGTTIDEWSKDYQGTEARPDNDLYEKSVLRAKDALKNGGVLKGILWLQGESDANKAGYMDKLKAIADGIRSELGVENSSVPFIVGEVPHVKPECVAVLQTSPQHIENCFVVSSEGLRVFDSIHLYYDAQRVFGLRFAQCVLDKIYGVNVSADKMYDRIYGPSVKK